MTSPELRSVGFAVEEWDSFIESIAESDRLVGIENEFGVSLLAAYTDESGARLGLLRRNASAQPTTIAALQSDCSVNAQVFMLNEVFGLVYVIDESHSHALDSQLDPSLEHSGTTGGVHGVQRQGSQGGSARPAKGRHAASSASFPGRVEQEQSIGDNETTAVSTFIAVFDDGPAATAGETIECPSLRVGALGVDVRLYPTVSAFISGRDAVLDPRELGDSLEAEPIAVGTRFLISPGAYLLLTGKADNVQAVARIYGVVVSCDLRTTTISGESWWYLRVDSVFSLAVAIPFIADVPAPQVGSVIAGDVLMVASLGTWDE